MYYFLLLILSLFNFSYVFAYVPNSDFILKEVVKNNGDGNYEIKKQLSFGGLNNTIVTETWNITSAKQMHLVAVGKDIYVDRYYEYPFVHEKIRGKIRRLSWPDEFFEDLFSARSLNHFKNLIVKKSLTSRQVLRWDPTSKAGDKIILTQNEAKTNYTYLRTPPSRNDLIKMSQLKYKKPGLWIEQDKFVISKIGLPKAMVVAEDYAEFSKNLLFPKNRHVKYGQYETTISVVGLSFRSKGLIPLREFRQKVKNTSFNNDKVALFYKRFR